MDACDLFRQNNGLKVKILGMGYVPGSGITTHVILPFVFQFNSLGFNTVILLNLRNCYQILGLNFS